MPVAVSRSRDFPTIEDVALHLVPGYFCSASKWASRIEPSQLNYDDDGNLRPTTSGLKGRDAAYGSYGLYLDEIATVVQKRSVKGCPEGEYLYDIQIESTGQMRCGVPRHSFWIAEEAPDADVHQLKVGTAVLIRATPRDPDTGQIKAGAGITQAKTCFWIC